MYAAPRYFATRYFRGIWPYQIEGGIYLYPTGVSQDIDFGLDRLDLGIAAAGIAENIEFGLHRLDLNITPVGFIQDINYGLARLDLMVVPFGVSQDQEFGIYRIDLSVAPLGFDQEIDLGAPQLNLSLFPQEIIPLGVGQRIEFGLPEILGGYRLEGPLEVTIRLVPTEELIRIATKPTPALVQFKELSTYDNNILASTQGNEMAKRSIKIKMDEATSSIKASPIGGNEMARAIKITIKQDSTGQIISTNPVTVESLPVGPSTRLDALVDVNATSEIEGGVPRYDVETDKYVVEKLDFSDLTGEAGDIGIDEVDGGSF